MYGINFSRNSTGQRVQFGLSPAVEFANLAEAFELIARDLENLESSLRNEERSDAWGSLALAEDVILSLSLEPHRDNFLLIVEDANSGSDTSTSVSSLAGAFDFMTYWAMDDFE